MRQKHFGHKSRRAASLRPHPFGLYCPRQARARQCTTKCPQTRSFGGQGRDELVGRAVLSNTSAMRVPGGALDDDAWEDLLSYIEERRVIPIIGPELLLVATERGPRLLYDWLPQRLARPPNVRTPPTPPALS